MLLSHFLPSFVSLCYLVVICSRFKSFRGKILWQFSVTYEKICASFKKDYQYLTLFVLYQAKLFLDFYFIQEQSSYLRVHILYHMLVFRHLNNTTNLGKLWELDFKFLNDPYGNHSITFLLLQEPQFDESLHEGQTGY